MCHKACLDFVEKAFADCDFDGLNVLEVGSYDFNGSARGIIKRHHPKSYLGVDILNGPGVDKVCAASDLCSKFGANAFDVVVSTEMLEHVEDWRCAIKNLKGVLKPGGVLLITTRSKGFPYHGYPYDFWRYEVEDFKRIFSDMEIIDLEPDAEAPGVFLKAVKRGAADASVADDDLALYSIRSGARTKQVPPLAMRIKCLTRLKCLALILRLDRCIPKGLRERLNSKIA